MVSVPISVSVAVEEGGRGLVDGVGFGVGGERRRPRSTGGHHVVFCQGRERERMKSQSTRREEHDEGKVRTRSLLINASLLISLPDAEPDQSSEEKKTSNSSDDSSSDGSSVVRASAQVRVS